MELRRPLVFSHLDSIVEKFFPYLFLVLCFTAPFANNVAGQAYLICLVLFVIQMFSRREYQLEARTYYLVALIYLAVILLSLTYTSDIEEGFRHFKQQCKLLIGVILIERVSSSGAARRYLYAFAAGGTVLAGIAIYQGLFLKVFRPPDLYHPIHGGSILLMAIVVLISLLFGERDLLAKTAVVAMLAINGAAIYLNGSRGVWFALAAVIVSIPFVFFTSGIRQKILFLVLLFLFPALLVICKGNILYDRLNEARNDFLSYKSSNSDTSLGARLEMWKASATMFRENQILGIGTGAWDKEKNTMITQGRVPGFLKQYTQPHSIYIDALATKGMIGLLSLLLMVLYPVYFALKSKEPQVRVFRNIVLLLVIGFSVSGLTDTIIRFRFVVMSYNLVLGLGLAMLVRSRVKAENSETKMQSLCFLWDWKKQRHKISKEIV